MAAGISHTVSAFTLEYPQIMLVVLITGIVNIWPISLLGMMPLFEAQEWTILILLVLIALVSLRIFFTQKKFSEELHQLSDSEKDA